MAIDRFELTGYPKNGRVDKYQIELLTIEKTNNINQVVAFANKLFEDCNAFLQSKYHCSIPEVHLFLVNHKTFSEEANRLDNLLGSIPRHRAFILFTRFSQPKIYIDLESHIVGHQPAESVVSLCIDFVEELIHASSPEKGEMGIHEDLCSIIEDFLEIKLPEELKKYRTEYSNQCDKINPSPFKKATSI